MIELPFQPIRTKLYSATELFQGLELSKPSSLERSYDLQVYRYFVLNGRSEPLSPFTSMMEALHDNFISQSLRGFLPNWTRIVGIMGGHKMDRGTAKYNSVSKLAYKLAQKNVLIVSGGGPGAMESAHLGAAMNKLSESDLDAVILKLAKQSKLPPLSELVSPSGVFNPDVRDALYAWWLPAIEAAADLGASIGDSLAIPTWHYGHEPFTPFASSIGKYFQNSIREEGLVTFCTDGVVYTEGKAGTLQEIFQDAAQNYYRSIQNRFSPMVFLGSHYWQNDIPAIPLLKKLFIKNDFEKYVYTTDSIDSAVDFLTTSTH